MSDYDFDLFVIGSGPAGQRAAVQAAKLGKRVGLAERQAVVGGVCLNTGTIPSKTLRAATMHLSGYHERSIYGSSYKVKQEITMADLLGRANHVRQLGVDVARHQMQRNGIQIIEASASFIDPHRILLTPVAGGAPSEITAANVVIGVGTTTTRDDSIAFDGEHIFTSDDILELKTLPKSLTVVGAGVIGIEYATIFATLGVRVTVVDKRTRLLPFVDEEIIDTLVHLMRQERVTMRLGEGVSGMELTDGDQGQAVHIALESGKHITTETVLYSIGRTGATETLNLEAAGLATDDRGRIPVNANYETGVEHIYAVGDVIGFPSLASTSMEQGRLAACHAFGVEAHSFPDLLPYGIYTIPEISVVGRNEQELTEAGTPYEVGHASYREIARGQIVGDQAGLLKLIFDPETRKLLGVHIIGDGACELIHIGQAVMSLGGTIDYLIDTVFNYPTFAECYKTAAFDGINRLG
ncbi:Si-specific NAD(P)(+) transhydrogenase [Thalassospiraceae bacterium LMO-JJ14]|nr:Si-specific NAD(P)(+) transhydrogenase [Thalassospiraceae bacterium LMO-JJ14]